MADGREADDRETNDREAGDREADDREAVPDDAELWRRERARQGWAELRQANREAAERERARRLWLDDGDEDTRTGLVRMTETESAAWGTLAAVLAALPAALDAQLRRDAGMRLVDFRVLAWLATVPQRTAQMAVLAEAAAISPSHLSRVAGRLEHRGWLLRVPDPDDGRATLAELTDAGVDAVRAAAPDHLTEVRRLVFGRLSTAHIAQLEQINRRILDAVRPGHCLRLP